jgi:hypothetical protein
MANEPATNFPAPLAVTRGTELPVAVPFVTEETVALDVDAAKVEVAIVLLATADLVSHM